MRTPTRRSRPTLKAAMLGLCLAACSLFEYSPYEVPAGTAGGESASRTFANLGRMEVLPKTAGAAFSLAVLADSHAEYDVLAEAVASINADSTIRFVVMAGDFTQYGLLKEYQWFRKVLSRLKTPYVTVIGNHDALANGPDIYRQLFGPLDYAFTFQDVRFVCLNTNIWEFSFNGPNWSWLEGELAGSADSLRVFVVSHIGPFGDQFDERRREKYTSLMVEYGVDLSIHGHQHNYRYEETFGDGISYLVADNVGDRNYVKVTVADSGMAVERVWF